MTQGEVNTAFWMRLSISMVLFGLIVLLIFPIIGRWFFKQVEDKISQYVFVLVMIYLAALLAELAGIEAIIGAFFAGLALDRFIPHTSTLMERVEFVGNEIGRASVLHPVTNAHHVCRLLLVKNTLTR